MNKVSKIVLYLLCLIGIAIIWEFLNKISEGNIIGVRLGDYIMMLIGSINLVNWIGDKIIKL